MTDSGEWPPKPIGSVTSGSVKAGIAPIAVVVAVAVGACGGDAVSSATTTTAGETTPTVVLTPTTTTSGLVQLEPNAEPFIRLGERGEYVAALQFLLICNGYERMGEEAPAVTVDGVFGPITGSLVAYAQAEMRRVPTGEPDEATFAALARRCGAERTIEFVEGESEVRVAGNVDPNDDDAFLLEGVAGQHLGLEVLDGPVQVTVQASEGTTIKAAGDEVPWSQELPADGVYRIRVISDETASYALRIELRAAAAVTVDFGPMVLAPDGLGILSFGAEPVSVLETIGFILGPPTTDTGWQAGVSGDRTCEGFNRHVTWVVQGAEEGDAHPAVLIVDFSDVGFSDPSFAQYGYRSFDLESLDVGSRGLATAEGVSLGSSIGEFSSAYGDPSYFDPDRGLVEITPGFVAGIDRAPEGEEDEPQGPFTERVWYLGAGADGCVDFG